jgi:hypothetical protein
MDPTTLIWTVPFYDIKNEKAHVTTLYGSLLSSLPLADDVRTVVSRLVPLTSPIDNIFFTVVYDYTSPGLISRYTKPVSTIADLINGWNVQASQNAVKHELIMDHAGGDEDLVRLTNMSEHTIHLFASSHTYIGCWTSHESKYISATSFVTTTSTPCMSISDPIVVMQDRLVFQLSAYIYKKKQQSDFIILTEDVMIPMGFYKDMTDLIAHMNKNIKMRGERNGFIYHFYQGKNGRMGIESSHRQPDPSFLLIKPTSCVLGMWEDEPHTLYLRTNKKYMFENTIARVIF